MKNPVIPRKLRAGDLVCVVSPSTSLAAIEKTEREHANTALAAERFHSLGLRVRFAPHVRTTGPFDSAPLPERVSDLHDAFADPEIAGIFTSIGGFNANQLLRHLDYDLIARNPKVLCGYSDITVLSGALRTKAGLVTYSGPHFSTLGMARGLEHTMEQLRRTLFEEGPFVLPASSAWSDDEWFFDQEHRTFVDNPGLRCLSEGTAEGEIVAGNLTTLHLLQGTEYMPLLSGRLLFVEDLRDLVEIDRVLQSILHTPGGAQIAGLVLGRCRPRAGVTADRLAHLVATKPALRGKPVVYGADIGHTTPHATIPFGGTARIEARSQRVTVEVLEH